MVQATSAQAFHQTADTRATREQQVLDVIRMTGPITNLEISMRLGKPINTITPATNALVLSGLVEEAYRDKSPITGYKSIFWREAA